jgi:hypothetical protein
MWAQLSQRHAAIDRSAVADDMEIRLSQVQHPSAGRVAHVRPPDIPFLGHRPIEHCRSGRDLPDVKGDVALEDGQRRRTPLPVMLRQIG